MSKYKPATFQPTIRPDWGGMLSYIPDTEKAEILVALLKYPSVECESNFWNEVIKPDLDLQYAEFTALCKIKSRGVRERWAKENGNKGIDLYNRSISGVIDPEEEREREYNNLYINNNNTGVINNRGLGEERRGGDNDPQINPPTLDDVIAEANLQNSMAGVGGYKISQEEAAEFFTTFASVGWRRAGESRTPITDWKIALRGWAIKKRKEKLAELEKDGIPIAPKPFRDDSKNAKK